MRKSEIRSGWIGTVVAMVGLGIAASLTGCGGSSGPSAVTISGASSVDPGDAVTFSATVKNDSNNAGVSWTLSGTGCTGSACGALSGTTTSSATYTAPTPVTTAFTVTITATSVAKTGVTGSATVSVPVNPAVTTPAGALVGGAVGTAYSVTLVGVGGISPYTWTVVSGSLPGGLSLSSAGVLAGTPAAVGSFNVTVKMTDAGSPALTATAAFTIAIAAAPAVVFSTTTLPGGTVGTVYSASVVASGGAGTLSYALASGSLPAGLSLSSAGALSGKPTAGGTSSFTVKAADAYGDTGTSGILAIAVAYPALTVTTTSVPNGVAGDAYSETLAAAGGTGTGYVWTVTSGGSSLTGVGLSVSSAGVLSGASPTAGTASFTVKVTDSASDTATANLTVTIGAGLTVTTTSLPNGTVGTSYSDTLAASGGSGAGYAWTVTAGTGLSAEGLSLSSAGVITGTPSTTETAASFTVKVTDSAGNTATATLALTVNYGALSITTSSIPGATVGTSYSEQFVASGGSGNYSWAVTTNLSGLTGESLTFTTGGLLSGTPTAVGSVAFTVTVTDTTTKNTMNGSYTLVVSSATAALCSHDGSGNSLLNGNYAFLLGGFDPNGNHYYQIGEFAADGKGDITSGNGDVNSSGFATQGEQEYTFTGTYSIGSTDDRGIMTVTNANTTATGLPSTGEYCFAADTVQSNVAQSGHILEADGSGFVVSGFFEIQDTADFTNSALSTGYAFELQGVNTATVNGSATTAPAGIIGQLVFNGAGGISSGQVDKAQYDPSTESTTYQAAQSIASGSTYSITSSGRGTLIAASSTNSTPFVIYLMGNGNRFVILSADNVSTTTLLEGQADQQTVTSFTTANVQATVAFRGLGASNVSSTSTPEYVDEASVGEMSLNGSGGVSVVVDDSVGGTINATEDLTGGTYTVSSLGYLQLSGVGKHNPNFYLYAPGAGFGMSPASSLQMLYLRPQTVPTGGFTTTSISGAYGLGTIPPMAYSVNGTGTASGQGFPSVSTGNIVTSAGTLTITNDNNSAPGLPADITVDQTTSNTWSLDPTYGANDGRFTVSDANGTQVVGYILSPAEVFAMSYQSGMDPSVYEVNHQ